MLDVEEAAGAAPVDDLVEGVGFVGGGGVGVEGDVPGGEPLVVVGGAVAAGLLADVLVGGAAVLDGLQRRRGVGQGACSEGDAVAVGSRLSEDGFRLRREREAGGLE